MTGQPGQMQLALNPAVSMPASMLIFDYNSQFSAMPAAPVGGTLSGKTELNEVQRKKKKKRIA